MEVINCRVKYIRPKYHNLKEWMEDPNNVYIGRAGIVFIDGKRFPPSASPFANPYKVGRDGSLSEILIKYEEYIRKKLEKDSELREELLSLDGKTLGCWCAPDPCHGDILIRILEEIRTENS